MSTAERLKAAGDFVDHAVGAIKAGSLLTGNTVDDRVSKAVELVLAENGIARGVVVEWIERSTRSEVAALDTTFDAQSQLEAAGIDVGTIRDLVGLLLTVWRLIRES